MRQVYLNIFRCEKKPEIEKLKQCLWFRCSPKVIEFHHLKLVFIQVVSVLLSLINTSFLLSSSKLPKEWRSPTVENWTHQLHQHGPDVRAFRLSAVGPQQRASDLEARSRARSLSHDRLDEVRHGHHQLCLGGCQAFDAPEEAG